MNWDADLSDLMKLCYLLIQSEARKKITPGAEWKNEAQVLSVKLFRHVATAQQISAGIGFNFGPGQDFFYIDHSSVAITVRAAVESYLAFKYIYGSEENISIYRHKLWRRAGLIDRSKMLANTPKSLEILRREAQAIEALRKEIVSSPYYLSSNRDERKEIDKGNWKPKGGWFSIIKESEIHKRYFNDLYSHMSGHSHASYISALQIRDAGDFEQQAMLAGSIRQPLCMIVSHFIFSYVKFFPDAESVMLSNPGLVEIARAWYVVKEDVVNIYGPV